MKSEVKQPTISIVTNEFLQSTIIGFNLIKSIAIHTAKNKVSDIFMQSLFLNQQVAEELVYQIELILEYH